eukprot:1150647-Pelagomonas_calceolata.AAC.1
MNSTKLARNTGAHGIKYLLLLIGQGGGPVASDTPRSTPAASSCLSQTAPCYQVCRIPAMGNCLASPGLGGSGGNGDVVGPVLTAAAGEGLSNTELVALLKTGTFEQRLAALQRLTKATSKTDEDSAAARYSLIQEEDVLGPLTQLLRATQRPALRAAAAQAFCNLSYACVEALEPAHKLGKSLEGVGEGLRSLILTDAVRDGPLTACQVRA